MSSLEWPPKNDHNTFQRSKIYKVIYDCHVRLNSKIPFILYILYDQSKRLNHKNKHHVQYSNVPSAIRPIPHGQDLPVPEPDDNMEYSSDSKHSDMNVVAGDNAYKPEDCTPVPLTQAELNMLAQHLNLSNPLGSHLKEKPLLAPGTMFYWYQDCARELREFFMFQDKSSLVNCNNIAGLIKSIGLEYDAKEWRLFIDSSSRSLKAVLLHNGNSFSSTLMGIQHKWKKLTVWITWC